MRRMFLLGLLALAALSLVLLGSAPVAHAQDWSYTLNEMKADVWINYEGSIKIEYYFTFTCDAGAHAIDAVDVGLPSGDFSASDIRADVGGSPVRVDVGDYQGDWDHGVAILLGNSKISPGQRGTVHVVVERLGQVIYEDSQDAEYASMQFGPTDFAWGVHGTTAMTVRFHLPPGVQAEEPRWHQSPSGWPSEPNPYHDDEERIVYEWKTAAADPKRVHTFGASFPRRYVAESAIQKTNVLTGVWGFLSGLFGLLCASPIFWVVFVAGFIVFAVIRSQSRRRMRYLPPSMKVEGVGIKRGLTAVEAAIVLETPLNRVLTMVLFGLLKKGAVTVLDDKPLQVQINEPRPEKLRPYEESFLAAVSKGGSLKEAGLRKMMIDLVKEVNNKMKGFSRKETVAYYQDIVRRAWQQVDGAETPEVRGQLFGEGLEWTMLDEDFEDRTERTFREGPVYVPIWWGFYRPWARTVPSTGAAPTAPAGPLRMPALPGSDFAASVVRGIQGTARNIVGSLTGFTGSVTQVTNPPPKPSSSYSGSSRGGGGGCACACACACAGCACACAGGGR